MQVSIEATDSIERRMTVELPEDQVSQAYDKKLKAISKTIRLDGFRQGKVPARIIKQRFSASIRDEVVGDLIRTSYGDALTEQNVQPLDNPQIEYIDKEAGEGIGYIATFEVMPEIELADLSSIKVTQQVAEVTDQDLETMIEKLRQQQVTWNDVEREAQDKDQLTISFEGFMDDEAFEGGQATDITLILGSGNMIDGFETGLIGSSAGDNVTLNVTFPEDYQAETLAGKEARFDVSVAKVSEPVLPEVDEGFATTYGVKEGGVEGLHKEIRNNMERELSEKLRTAVKQQAMDALIEHNEFNIPKVMVKNEAKALMEQTKQNMQNSGQAAPGFDLPINLFEGQAERRIKLGLLIAKIADQHDIQIDQDKVTARINQFAESYEDSSEVIDYYANDDQARASVENVIIEDQVVDWILEQGTVTEESTDFETIMNAAKEGTK